jgi:acetoin utilization deacetylase AcuC-like enzyme
LKVVYSARYRIDIGPHVFPTDKYQRVHARLLETGVIQPADVVEPEPASWADLARVHTADYLERMRHGAMTPADVQQLELPWSREMVEGFRVMTGGTVQAALIACGLVHDDRTQPPSRRRRFGEPRRSSSPTIPSGGGRSQSTHPSTGSGRALMVSLSNHADSAFKVACHLGGGLHHAFPNHGEGFCPFNDVAVAVRVLQARGVERVAIVDLDVHHGNGTAFIFESDPRVFTFSMHQQHNYPMWKPRGSLDVGLPDGAGDAKFLDQLGRALPLVMAHRPQCVFFLAGADPYEDDQLGGLRLTQEGLRERDRVVIEAVRGAGVPLVVALAGGYARRVDDTVAIHAATIAEAKKSEVRSLKFEV